MIESRSKINKKLAFSIVVPTFNSEKYLEKTIDSIFKQSHQNVSLIIQDGGSTDNTMQIVNNLPMNFDINFFSENDKGQYDAINKGLLKAKGDIIGYINSDDYYSLTAIKKVNEVFNNFEVDIVYGNFTIIDSQNNIIENMIIPRAYSRNWLRRYMLVNPSATFFRRKVIDDGNLFDVQFTHGADWDFFLTLAKKGYKFYYLPETICYFREHTDSKTRTFGKAKWGIERKKISKKQNIPYLPIFLTYNYLLPFQNRFYKFKNAIKKKDFNKLLNLFSNYFKNKIFSGKYR